MDYFVYQNLLYGNDEAIAETSMPGSEEDFFFQAMPGAAWHFSDEEGEIPLVEALDTYAPDLVAKALFFSSLSEPFEAARALFWYISRVSEGKGLLEDALWFGRYAASGVPRLDFLHVFNLLKSALSLTDVDIAFEKAMEGKPSLIIDHLPQPWQDVAREALLEGYEGLFRAAVYSAVGGTAFAAID